MTYKKLALLTSTLLLFSCTSKLKDIAIDTYPEGATIHVNGKLQEGTTPLIASVPQREEVGIVAMKQGYKTASKTLKPQTSTFYGIIWTLYDERARYIEEDKVTLHLEKIQSSANYQPTTLAPYQFPKGPQSSSSSSAEAPPLRPMPE